MRPRLPRLAPVVLSALALLAWAPTAQAVTFTVNSTADTTDGTCDAAPNCTLREAIDAANANSNAPTVDNISFAGLASGQINVVSVLSALTEPTNVDGTTATGFVGPDPVIEINGGGTVTTGLELQGGSTVNGLSINSFTSYQVRMTIVGSNTITRNYIGLNPAGTAAGTGQNLANGIYADSGAPSNTIGNSSGTGRNVIGGNGAGIRVDSTGNTIRNNYVGTADSGSSAVPNSDGLVLVGASNTVGGSGANEGNLFSGNTQAGVLVANGASLNTLRGNIIGLNAGQLAALPNASGISVQQGDQNTIGGSAAGQGNVISGNGSVGVAIFNEISDANVLTGNKIGTDGTGLVDFANGGDGVQIFTGPDNNVIGGTGAGEGNIIANSADNGVQITRAGNDVTGNQVLRNAIFDNGSLGIDLGNGIADGITANDANDADTAAQVANEGQNFPVITSVVHSGGNSTVNGTLDAERASTQYRIEVYENTACNPLVPNGEGQTFVTFQNVTTDASGNATFSIPATGVASGEVVTTTATDFVLPNPAGTSEFSACVTSGPTPPTGLATTPAGPANNNFVNVSGAVDGSTTVVEIFDNPTCSGAPEATNGAATFEGAGIQVNVSNDTTTTFYAVAHDGVAGSACSSASVTYVEDSTALAPALSGTNPASGSASTAPRVIGTAEPGSTVRIYSDALCTALVASGTAAQLASPGIQVGVPMGQTQSFRAAITDQASNVSGCSSPIAYTAASSADLAMGLAVPQKVQPGAPVTLLGTVINRGPGVAPGTVLAFSYPTWASYRSGSDGCSEVAPGSARCSIGTLANGAFTSRQITIVPSKVGVLTTSVTASSSASDPVSTNNSGSLTITAALPPPVTKKSFNATVVKGEVSVKCPGDGRFRGIKGDNDLRIGCQIDTRKGRISLTTTAGGGKTQTALFYDGVFRVGQTGGKKPITELKLTGKLENCAKKSKRASAAARKRRGRRLWGNGKGRFRTRGKRSSALVRGTIWLVEDRCDGSTLTQVKRGKVTVRDFGRRKNVTVKKGKRYVAKARGTGAKRR